jgi:hypothetical protein
MQTTAVKKINRRSFFEMRLVSFGSKYESRALIALRRISLHDGQEKTFT